MGSVEDRLIFSVPFKRVGTGKSDGWEHKEEEEEEGR